MRAEDGTVNVHTLIVPNTGIELYYDLKVVSNAVIRMGPTKGYRDTNDGIAVGIGKGYEISPQSSLNSKESDPPPVDCANSSEESSTSSANSVGSNSLSCGNSTNGSSSSSANSDGSYIYPASSTSSDESSVHNEDGTHTLGDSNWTFRPTGNRRENLRSDMNIPQFPEIYQTDPPLENNRGNRPGSPCCCSKRKAIGAVVFAAVLLSIAVGIFVGLTQNVIDDAACQFLTNEIICPFEREYKRIDILSPPVYLKNGAGRTSYNLSKGTDIRINGFLIKVTDTDISVRKQPSECAEEGEYPIIFSRENNSQSETKLPLKIKDFNDTMQMEIIPFTNTSDNERYVQFICTGYHQCGTVVMYLELQAPDFGTYNTPMKCSRTNIDGTVMDKYGYACTLIMDVEMFQRTENLKCKPTVETLQNTKTTSIAQKSIDVNETTRSHYILRKLANETIKWNVNVQTLKDIGHLQTKYNGDFRGNKFDLDDRVKLSTSVKGSIATCHVVFSPVTCIDEGPWELHLLNSTQRKEIQVTGTSTITACPSLVNGTVSEKLELKFTSCVPDDVRTYALNLYGKTNRRGSFLKDKSIEVVDQTSYFRAHLHLNELSVIYTKEPITCADHMMIFMMSLQTKGGDTIQNITSLTNVIAGRDRYKTYSTGGDFRENIPSVVRLRGHLGCRPQNMTIHINGSLLASKYALSEDLSTGEKIFTKTFLFPKLRMQDNGTVVELHFSFIDDERSRRNLSIKQVIRVIPDTFCLGRPHGCNYRHPYNSNMWIACGEGLIAEFGNCQSGLGLVFVPTSCEGECLRLSTL